MNPQTFHKATGIGCGCVALDEHLKGDSKTYLSCSIKLCVYQLCKTSVKDIARLLKLATLAKRSVAYAFLVKISQLKINSIYKNK